MKKSEILLCLMSIYSFQMEVHVRKMENHVPIYRIRYVLAKFAYANRATIIEIQNVSLVSNCANSFYLKKFSSRIISYHRSSCISLLKIKLCLRVKSRLCLMC